MQHVIPVFINLYGAGNLTSKLENKGVSVYSLNIAKTYGFNEAVSQIVPIIEKEKPEIIHSTLYRADLIARKLKSIFPDIILVGSFVSNSYGLNRYRHLSTLSKLKLFSTQLKDRLTAGKVDFFLCNSNAIKKTNVKALNVDGNKVQVIYRGRCLEDFNTSIEAQPSLLRELDWIGQKIFLNVGRLNKGKGQIDLLKAFSVINKENPNTLLVIAGEGSLRRELEKLIRELQLQKKVFLMGYREDIPSLLALADFFVFPTYFEGLPGSLVEAIISKTPAIVSDIPENRECFPGDEALFFPPGDINKLSRQMKQALEMDDWESRTDKAATNASEKFNIQRISKDYENFYQKIFRQKNI
ncbi:glycosyltransferase [Salinimicrobium xinjiangense]|uniref:glycosyltransferase n=1 Tax=Salinimicrobium xinjiangense TaxID=438596 RepID=UPI00146F7D8D|nr:glycosyltransferase [Salinimicrobium xinjiangense]